MPDPAPPPAPHPVPPSTPSNAAAAIAWGNRRHAKALIAGFTAAGVKRAVISPGSRNSPLVHALLQQSLIGCDFILDERSAAFFALGLARASGRPPLLVCTSGSALAHYLPAVMEAHHSGQPLLILSADRPREAIGWGANQAVEQRDLLAGFVRASHPLDPPSSELPSHYLASLTARAVAESLGTRPGPVHLNQPFREPLWPGSDWPISEAAADTVSPAAQAAPLPGHASWAQDQPDAEQALSDALLTELLTVVTRRPGVIFCGQDGWGHEQTAPLRRLAWQLGAPLLADPLSNVRYPGLPCSGALDEAEDALAPVCTHQEAWLRHPRWASQPPGWVLRFGQPPVARTVRHWLEGDGTTRHWVIAPRNGWSDPGHGGAVQLAIDPQRLCAALLDSGRTGQAACTEKGDDGGDQWQQTQQWQQQLLQAEHRAAQVHAALGREAASATDPAACWEAPLLDRLFQTLAAQHEGGINLFCGNSMAIRDLDSFSGNPPLCLELHANRGVSGIDGQMSTAAGIASHHASHHAQNHPRSGRPTLALIGDLACLHDLNALGLVAQQPLIVVVINNGGGGIFEYLPEASQPRAQFERGWITPQSLQLEHAARAFGLPWSRVDCLEDWQRSLQQALAAGGPMVIEVMVDRAASVAAHRRYWAAVVAAVGD